MAGRSTPTMVQVTVIVLISVLDALSGEGRNEYDVDGDGPNDGSGRSPEGRAKMQESPVKVIREMLST
jgi:hypothetical protein